jgi:ribosomal protein S18 acetylase RimI-like enzyme
MEYWHDRVINAAAGRENALFVAEDGHEWIGLVGGWVFEEAGSQVPYLISMWVDPGYRGRGIGQALVEQAIDWVRGRGMDHLIVEVEATNRNAISLYTRCGFRPTGEVRPHPTYPGLQEVMMKLALDHE